MPNYITDYPVVVVLENNEISTLTVDDNRSRTLITETESTIEILSGMFESEGFRQSAIEEKKVGQLCDGFRKKLSEEWDMHVRLIEINTNKIAIDAEVETSTEYIQHLTKPEYWVSVIFEVHDILKKYQIPFKTWHKKSKSYILNFVQNTSLELRDTDGKIKWKPIAVGVAIAIALGLVIALLLKK